MFALRFLRAIAFVFVLAVGARQLHAQSFQGLGNLPGGENYSRAEDVSSDGSVVVGYSYTADFITEAFRWTESGGMKPLGFLAGRQSSTAFAVADDGNVIAGGGYEGNYHAFRWTASGGIQGLGFLPGGQTSIAVAVSADGNIIVGGGHVTNGNFEEAFRWTASGGMLSIGSLPGGTSSYASAISADGNVIAGHSRGPNGIEAFRWTASGGMVGLGDLPGGAFNSSAASVSADGSVIVGSGTGVNGTEAFRWTVSGGMVGLGDVVGGTFRSIAVAVSADGSVVLGNATGPNGTEAAIWTEALGWRLIKTMLEDDHDIDMTGWTQLSATGLSADGKVAVGSGRNPQGQNEAWRADFNASAEWVASVSGFFNEPIRWSINDIPSAQHAVSFNAAGAPYTVTLVKAQASRGLTVEKGEATLDLGGSTYSLGADALRVNGTETDEATLRIEAGLLEAADVILRRIPGGSATLIVGNFTIPATLEVDGRAVIGKNGEALLQVLHGSTATIRGGLTVAENDGRSSSVFVEGGLLQVTEGTAATFIGHGGSGTIEVFGGGTLSLAGSVSVGTSSPNGNGLIKLFGGASGITNGTLIIGEGGVGGLDVKAAKLTSNDVILGLKSGSFGTALVDGSNSVWQIADQLVVGKDGAGFLLLTNGGTLHATTNSDIGPLGHIDVADGIVCVATACELGHNAKSGQSILITPSLTVHPGALVEADAILVQHGGVIGGDGTLDLPITNGGTLSPGGTDSTAIFTLDNDYAQEREGRLEIEFSGTAPGTGYDQLAVTGTAALGGTLRLDRIVNYVPSVGETYTLLTAASVTGAFDTIELPAGVAFDVSYTTTEVIATVTGVSVGTETDGTGADLPQTYVLHAAYPNPFSSQTIIEYELPQAGYVRLAVYDALGREVAVLVDAETYAASNAANFDGAGRPSGIYFVRMTAEGFAQTRTVTLLR